MFAESTTEPVQGTLVYHYSLLAGDYHSTSKHAFSKHFATQNSGVFLYLNSSIHQKLELISDG
jgi:hypothetical protein